jgi:thiol-disulfide isomerase/thioredoxin
MKIKVTFILLVSILYFFNLFGRIYGVYLNFIITGILNFIVTYYLLKNNPFAKTGLFFIYFPLFLLFTTVFYGVYNNLPMPGLLGFIIYFTSTIFAFLSYKFNYKLLTTGFYMLIYIYMLINYDNLNNYYFSIIDKNKNINKELPNFNIYDKLGNKIDIKNTNKILVIDFWSLTCSNCIKTFPKFENVKKTYEKEKNIEFLSINIYNKKEDIEKSKKIIDKYTFKTLYTDRSIFRMLDFKGVPNYMIIDKKNKIKYFGTLNVEKNETYNNIYNLIDNEK